MSLSQVLACFNSHFFLCSLSRPMDTSSWWTCGVIISSDCKSHCSQCDFFHAKCCNWGVKDFQVILNWLYELWHSSGAATPADCVDKQDPTTPSLPVASKDQHAPVPFTSSLSLCALLWLSTVILLSERKRTDDVQLPSTQSSHGRQRRRKQNNSTSNYCPHFLPGVVNDLSSQPISLEDLSEHILHHQPSLGQSSLWHQQTD